MVSVKFHKLASIDLFNTIEYYDSINSSISYQFMLEFEYYLEDIKNNPLKYSIYDGEIRKCIFKKFPFNILFIKREYGIYIIGIIHHKRSLKILKKRKYL